MAARWRTVSTGAFFFFSGGAAGPLAGLCHDVIPNFTQRDADAIREAGIRRTRKSAIWVKLGPGDGERRLWVFFMQCLVMAVIFALMDSPPPPGGAGRHGSIERVRANDSGLVLCGETRGREHRGGVCVGLCFYDYMRSARNFPGAGVLTLFWRSDEPGDGRVAGVEGRDRGEKKGNNGHDDDESDGHTECKKCLVDTGDTRGTDGRKVVNIERSSPLPSSPLRRGEGEEFS